MWCCCSFAKSCPTVWPHGLQRTGLPCPSPSPEFAHSCPLNQWCSLAITSLCHPLLLLPSIFPSIRVFSSESALCIIMWWASSNQLKALRAKPEDSGKEGTLLAIHKSSLSFPSAALWNFSLTLWHQPELPACHLVLQILDLYSHVSQFLKINLYLCLYSYR